MKTYIEPISSGVTRPNEANDCCVRALANSSGMTYRKAHKLFEKHGRVPLDGTEMFTLASALSEMKYPAKVFKSTRAKHWTNVTGVPASESYNLNAFLKSYNTGNYIVVIGSHAIAVVDGKVIDTGLNNLRRFVQIAWRVS